MTNGGQSLTILLRAWVTVVGVVASCGWLLSAAGLSFLAGPVALAILLGLAVWRRAPLGRAMVAEGRALVRWWPVAAVFTLMAILAFAYQPSVHDTLTYRLPRVRLWMQGGGLEWYSSIDTRINSLGRNWEWLGMAILQVTGSERLLTLPSLVSWVLLCRLFFGWAEKLAGPGRPGRSAGLVLATSPLFVVQGFTTMNDLLAAGLVAISVVFLIRSWEGGERGEAGIDLVFSGMALAVATGVKPNLGTLVPVWCLGAVFWLVRRRGALPWKLLVAAVPVAVVASGLPTLIMNQVHTGSLMAKMGTGEMSVAPAHPLAGMVLGHLMFWWQSVQPVFNPLAGVLNSATAGIDDHFSAMAPRFQLETELFKFGESATIGTFSTILIVSGVVLAVWKGRSASWRGFGLLAWIAIGGLVGMSLNFATAIPYELGRSSVAFLVPLIPLALLGFGTLAGRWRLLPPALAVASVVFCVLHMAMEPNRSLLPAKLKASLLEKAGAREKTVDAFRRFRDRRFSGKELYEMVPEGEEAVAICLGRAAPTAAAWRYLPRGTKVLFFPVSAIEDLQAAPVRYVVMTGRPEDVQPVLDRTDLFEVVAERTYLIRLSEGDLPWYLLRKVEAARP